MSKQSGGFFSNFCGLLRISELYTTWFRLLWKGLVPIHIFNAIWSNTFWSHIFFHEILSNIGLFQILFFFCKYPLKSMGRDWDVDWNATSYKIWSHFGRCINYKQIIFKCHAVIAGWKCDRKCSYYLPLAEMSWLSWHVNDKMYIPRWESFSID